MAVTGRAHVFGDNVNTDYITPTDYFGLPMDELATHLFEPIDPAFSERFEPGDLVVAGRNFGSGSSRETAPKALQTAGVAAVVAESFARLFYRNGIAIGLRVVTCPDATAVVERGDEVTLDLAAGRLSNDTAGETAGIEPMPPAMREIFEAGGLLTHYRQHPEGLRLE